jgi:hypothetical protein
LMTTLDQLFGHTFTLSALGQCTSTWKELAASHGTTESLIYLTAWKFSASYFTQFLRQLLWFYSQFWSTYLRFLSW